MHDIKYGKEPRNKLSGNNYLNILNNQISYKTNIVSFKNQYIETLFVQGRNLVPSRTAIGWRGLFTFRQPLTVLLGTRFLPWTNKVSTCRKALYATILGT